MRIEFEQSFNLPVDEVFSYFRTPADWVRLYGFAGKVDVRGDGWYAVPLKRFPFPLVARVTDLEPNRLAHWVFKGFWRGEGEVRFSQKDGLVTVEGFEDISMPRLLGLGPAIERRYLEPAFRSIWELGWRRLQKREPQAA